MIRWALSPLKYLAAAAAVAVEAATAATMVVCRLPQKSCSLTSPESSPLVSVKVQVQHPLRHHPPVRFLRREELYRLLPMFPRGLLESTFAWYVQFQVFIFSFLVFFYSFPLFLNRVRLCTPWRKSLLAT